MTYLIPLIILLLVFLILHYFTELTQKQKLLTLLTLGVISIFASYYNYYSNTQRDRVLEVINSFNQGKSVTCDDIEITKENFTLSIGTYTFIGKKDGEFSGQMISASRCK
ncbi:MAG: hypothetical protein WC144_05970 [Sulfurimonas sp.]|jgi:hypothetical protein|nr:hypothetical protein [Sulfurimonadaceae bacterium]